MHNILLILFQNVGQYKYRIIKNRNRTILRNEQKSPIQTYDNTKQKSNYAK